MQAASMASSNAVDMPDHFLDHFMHYFNMFRNDTEDFRQPHLRRSVVYVYPLFVFLYAVVVVAGTVSNVAVICTIVRRRLYRDPTYFFMINLALSDIVKCLVVLPITLTVLLVQNWIFGSFLCYFIPMMQDIPIHGSMLTFVLIAIDRYRFLMFSMASRAPRCLCVLGIWMTAVCVVLPYVFYIRYFDFEAILGPQVAGAGFCTLNIEDDMEEYIRGMFIALYVLPLAIIAFLYVRVGAELKARDNPLTSNILFEMSSTEERTSHSTTCTTMNGMGPARSSSDTPCPGRSSWMSHPNEGLGEPLSSSSALDNSRELDSLRRYDYVYDFDNFDVRQEIRTQKYLISMVTVYAMCLCPLKLLGLAKHVVETYDVTGHFDVAFITFVWIGFVSTCTTPALFASWRMSRSAKDRLRDYFRFTNRQQPRRLSTPATATATTTELQPPSHGNQPIPPAQRTGHEKRARKISGSGHNNEGYTHSTPASHKHLTVGDRRGARRKSEASSEVSRKHRGETRSNSLG